MRWKDKTPKEGDVRIKDILCIIPTKINGVWYWLEKIKVKQVFEIAESINCSFIFYWENIEVVDND